MKARKILRKTVLFIFVILLSASFIVYLGGTNEILTPEAQEIGRVGDHIIKNSRDSNFTRNYEIVLNRYERRLENQPIDQDTLNQIVIREAFIETVIDYLISEENKKNKIFVSDQQIIDSIIELYFNGNKKEYDEFIKTADILVLKRIESGARAYALKKVYLESLVGYVPVSTVDYNIDVDLANLEKKAVIGIIGKETVFRRYLDEGSLLLDYFKANISRYTSNLQDDPPTENSSSLNNNLLQNSGEDLSSALQLTNQNNNQNTGLSEAEIIIEFNNNKEKVEEDYLLENSDNFIQRFREEFNLTVEAINQREGFLSKEEINVILENFSFQNIRTDFYTYNSLEIKDEESQVPIVRDPRVIKNMFLVPKNQISPIDDNGDFFFVSFNYEEERNQSELSSFIKRQFQKQIEEDFKDRITEEYYDFIIRNHSEEIYLFGQKLEI